MKTIIKQLVDKVVEISGQEDYAENTNFGETKKRTLKIAIIELASLEAQLGPAKKRQAKKIRQKQDKKLTTCISFLTIITSRF